MAITSFRRGIEEMLAQPVDESIVEGRQRTTEKRTGYAVGIPVGGSTEINAGGNVSASTLDRPTFMLQLLQAYLSCTWSSACIDVIARTCTAGGIDVVYISGVDSDAVMPEPPPEVAKVQQLLAYVNPHDDIRQLMRAMITDLMIFGDAFLEVVWVMGEPAALYPLDPTTMTVIADEHGVVKGYFQKTQTNRQARFKPREVIHVKFDSPGDTLYGVSPTQKNILPITSWLFTAALIKETMKRGDPMRAHVDWPIALPESEMKRLQQQYATRNLGAKNIGNLFETKGGAVVNEMGTNQINNWLSTLQQRRDEILSGYGVPPSKVGVIEAGNLGGGTGTQQDKTFRVNTCGPIQELLLEKLTFAILYQAYGLTDWIFKFGAVDWRDDEVIEKIRDMRIRNGTWTLNRGRADIGEPAVDGGDNPILVDRQNMVLWSDLEELSHANLDAVKFKGEPKNSMQMGQTNPDATVSDRQQASSLKTPAKNVRPTESARGPEDESSALEGAWNKAYQKRRKEVLKELPHLEVGDAE
jgi:hypothetical protein